MSQEQDDEQSDIDSAAEHQQVEEARRHKEQDPEVKFWANVHDDMLARHRAEAAQLDILNRALDKLFK